MRYNSCNKEKHMIHMQRIQPGARVLESDRISKMLDKNVFTSHVLGTNQGALLCTEPNYIDIVIGQDIETAYIELKNLNHVLRILETVFLKIKNRKSIVVFE
ncbi:encapsulin [Clostridium tyrobutyricum]|uniref:encapsulin n=2 Tax=Clostridium tyrobutyricum TaxID=1519 RepID=UPI003001E332